MQAQPKTSEIEAESSIGRVLVCEAGPRCLSPAWSPPPPSFSFPTAAALLLCCFAALLLLLHPRGRLLSAKSLSLISCF